MNTFNHKVSIITPVYNSAAFIAETLNAVINQTHTNWELIAVDDCSKDNSLSILEEYAVKDKRIKIIIQDENQGQITARNMALQEATGRYIAFLDSDDIWKPHKLERQLQFMKNKNAAIVHSYYENIDENGDKLNKTIKAPLIVNYKQLLNTNYLGCLTVLYDTKKIGKHMMPYVGKRDDWACWLNILKQGHVAYCIPEVLAFYRIHSNSLSSNKMKTSMYNWGILRNNQNLPIPQAAYHFSMYFFLSIKKYYLS